MPISSPNLDDRTFDQLVREAKELIAQKSPNWTDLSAHDPGVVLLEVFAYLTETMLYRLNRVPEKAYVEFLRLIGVKLQPPAAASTVILFSIAKPAERAIEIPRGMRVTNARASGGVEPVVFATASATQIEVGKTEARAVALHCELVEGELAGTGNGRPGLTVNAKRPPIVAPTGDALDLVVGVEADPGELDDRAPALRHQDKAYRIWREVDSFVAVGDDRHVYVVDRMEGAITFAPSAQMLDPQATLESTPSALAAIPKMGREIRLWYRRGGGPLGNVAAGVLDTLKDPIPQVAVSNPSPAVGGRAAETLENALIRGPEEIHSLRRAITARDFEMLALRSSGAVVRAKAFTQSQLWAHAPPGTVEVLLVPDVPPAVRGSTDEGVTAANLRSQQTEPARARIRAELDDRRPLGTTCLVNWARYKTVAVKARVVAHRAEDTGAIRSRVLERLYRTVNPLPSTLHPTGWRFGQALRVSNVYDIVLSEPGVGYADQVRLVVDEVPQAVKALESDHFQAQTWYAGSGEVLFRSVNNGDGWEPAGLFPGEEVDGVHSHPNRPGLIAVSTRLAADPNHSRLHISWDCGETWDPTTQTVDAISDMAWIIRDGIPVLFLATRVGLFEVAMQLGGKPLQVLVDPKKQDMGFWSVVTSTDSRGTSTVAVAATEAGSVYLSALAGRKDSFQPIPIKYPDADVRRLKIQRDGPRSWLWAGVAAIGNESGKGCFFYDLDSTADWKPFDRGWDGGSCLAISFAGSMVFAGSHRAGVLWADSSKEKEGVAWSKPDVGCGLPLREKERLFQPVTALASAREGLLILSGGSRGVYRTQKLAVWEASSVKEFTEKVTLPPTWLFCSGKHEVEVVHDDAAQAD